MRPVSDFRKALRPWLKPKIIMGGSLVFLLIFMGVLAPLISPYDPNLQNLANTLKAPQWLDGAHFLGTDHVGRDILSRIFYGARISLVIAGTVVVVSGVIGVGLGAISGYFAGRTDFFIQKLVEVIWAFPPLLLAIAVIAFFG
ncbi:MAG: D,D-dipeptide ABC transporter permease, partial [Rhodospirillaceae bacterium]|nr:D,D-dipeptide ABC transporter permease [Rhodospirillaceae bacterium]